MSATSQLNGTVVVFKYRASGFKYQPCSLGTQYNLAVILTSNCNASRWIYRDSIMDVDQVPKTLNRFKEQNLTRPWKGLSKN